MELFQLSSASSSSSWPISEYHLCSHTRTTSTSSLATPRTPDERKRLCSFLLLGQRTYIFIFFAAGDSSAFGNPLCHKSSREKLVLFLSKTMINTQIHGPRRTQFLLKAMRSAHRKHVCSVSKRALL